MTIDVSHAAVMEFRVAVNMSPKVLTAWLKTAESQAVGLKITEGSESVGHHSGKRVVVLLDKPESEFTAGDLAHARKVVGFIHRHLAQRPAGDITQSPWRYSLMNWGHDPHGDSS